MYLKDSKTVVIKIGSSLLINDRKIVREKWLTEFAKDVQYLKKLKKNIILVSSGAIALGCKKLKLSKKVLLVTPNIPEAEILTKTKIITKEDMIFAANKLIGLGAKNVLIKGGHLKHKNVLDILINTKDLKIFKSERHKTKNTHGTGCTLSSSITTFLSCGKTVKKSCELGIKYVNSAIKSNPKYGKGHGPINHLTSVKINRKFKE